MRIKSYFANTVEDAIAVARQELGADAMLVNSRKSSPEARHLGGYEVVFATDVEEQESTAVAPLMGGGAPPDRLSADVAELKRELEGMRRTLLRPAFSAPQWQGASADASAAFAALRGAELDAELARDVVEAAEAAVGGRTRVRGVSGGDAALFQAIGRELQSRFGVSPTLGVGNATPHIVALVGPPGAGKTTTLVKLAVNYGLASRRSAVLLSMDTYRVAAGDQLRSFAAILGVGFRLLDTPGALAQQIEENRGKELLLIDTPGYSGNDLDDAAPLAQFLRSRADIDLQLVLPATVKNADLTRMVDHFEIFNPQRLLFTKVDETASFGPLINQAVRTSKPLSFFTTGQRIPEDLEEVSYEKVLDLLLGSRSPKARTAA